ncbi:MAG: hypothetical protein J6C46_12520 [Clostridia bacterium]|nr:hypothetical protein [Clostridia bacterium]
MNKKYIKINSLIMIMITTIIVLTGCFNDDVNYDSGSKIEPNETTEDENQISSEQRLYIDFDIEELKNKIIAAGNYDTPEVLKTEEVTSEYDLAELNNIEAIVIKEEKLNSYQEVAIVKLINEEQCDKIIEKFIYRYEDLKENKKDYGTILYSKENIAIKQQAGVGIFIVSTNKNEIESEINKFFD